MYRRKRRRTKKVPKSKYKSAGLHFGRKTETINISVVKEIITWIVEIAITIFIAAIFVTYVGYRIPVLGQSMAKTLKNGEQVLTNRFVYKVFQPKKNDIVVFRPNGNDKSHYYIKRVIGVPGDTVQIKEGIVYVNDEPFEEEIDVTHIDKALMAEEAIVVKDDEYFVLGDNRNNSEDSRYANIGNVKREHLVGKAWLAITSWKKFRFL